MSLTLLSVEEIAERLNVPASWVYSRTREKGPDAIPRLKVGKYVRFELEKVLAWIRKHSENEYQ
jgi:excisionase family DNA binding protein